jgi:dUTP pyrophosphatase
VIVPTGLKFNISPGFHVKIYPRSSVPLKSGLLMVNSVGIIDEDYKDEIMILLINMSDDTVVIENGDRIAQMEVVNNQSALVFMNEQEVLIERNGGLGSTGV